MKIEIEATSLSDAIKVIMFRACMTVRQLAEAIGVDPTTTWRAINRPSRASAKVLFTLIKYLGIPWDEFAELFQKELEHNP